MKKAFKLFALLFAIFTALTFASCKAKDDVGHTSSAPIVEQQNDDISNEQQTLLKRIIVSQDLNAIKNITISDATNDSTATITDKDKMAFLQKYEFSKTLTDKRENWDVWLKENSTLNLLVDTTMQGEYNLYLINDDSIAIQEMCGDSEVPEITYEFYVAEEKDRLTKEILQNS